MVNKMSSLLQLPASCAVLGEWPSHSLDSASLFVCISSHTLQALYRSTGNTTGAVNSICTEQTQILESLSAGRGLSLAGTEGFLYFCPDAAGESQLHMTDNTSLFFRLGISKFLLMLHPSFHLACMAGAKKAPPQWC